MNEITQGLVISGGLTISTIDNEIITVFGDVRMQIIEKTTKSCFLVPTFAG
jgi:hypothetical protein